MEQDARGSHPDSFSLGQKLF